MMTTLTILLKIMAKSHQYSAASLNQSYLDPTIVNQRNQTLAALTVSAGDHALDVGCGSGLLTIELGKLVGVDGRVYGIDMQEGMVQATAEFCRDLPQITAQLGDVTKLPFESNSFDVVTCPQVLLYVEDIESALTEMTRVLKPSGQLAILETDWRGVVINSRYPALSDRIFAAWDNAVPSPNLPVTLNKSMKHHGVIDISSSAIPILNTENRPDNFSNGTMTWMSANAVKHGAITQEEGDMWCTDLAELGDAGEYFFCVNRFLFVGKKPAI